MSIVLISSVSLDDNDDDGEGKSGFDNLCVCIYVSVVNVGNIGGSRGEIRGGHSS